MPQAPMKDVDEALVKDEAQRCLSLAYKYGDDLQDCISSQGMHLLLGDPVLASLKVQRDMIEQAFAARVQHLAYQE